MKKLISMTEYVDMRHELMEEGEIVLFDYVSSTWAYAKLLQTPLKLGQFVPCNSKGEPMEKPSEIASFGQFEYQEACGKVLFKGWEMDTHDYIKRTKDTLTIRLTDVGETIEDLLTARIELEPTEICNKQAGL